MNVSKSPSGIPTAKRFGNAMADHIGVDRCVFHIALEKAGYAQPLLYLDDLDRLCGGDVALAAASHYRSVHDALLELADRFAGSDHYERSCRALERYACRVVGRSDSRTRELDPRPAQLRNAA